MTETEEILERVSDRVKNLTRPQTSRDAYWRLVRAFGEAAMWARDPKGIESEAISVAAFAVLLASVAKQERPSPEDRARSLHGKLDRILKHLAPSAFELDADPDRVVLSDDVVFHVPKDSRSAETIAAAAEMFTPDPEGSCPSCGAELGRDHGPGCRLPGIWSDLTHCQRVVQERRERCIVLWNALCHLMNSVWPKDHETPATAVAKACLEGGPLGHQGEITDADRLTLSDVYRASGAKERPDDDVVDVSLCPLCEQVPVISSCERGTFYACSGGAEHEVFYGPRFGTIIDAAKGWNAVVNAWQRGFEKRRGSKMVRWERQPEPPPASPPDEP